MSKDKKDFQVMILEFFDELVKQLKVMNMSRVEDATYFRLIKEVNNKEGELLKKGEVLFNREGELSVRERGLELRELRVELLERVHKIEKLRGVGGDANDLIDDLRDLLDKRGDEVKNSEEYKRAMNV